RKVSLICESGEQDIDRRYPRVHPPLPDARVAARLPPHPLLRSTHKPNPRQEYRARPRVARSATHPGRCHQSRQCQPRGAKSTRASLPLLRQLHAHHRDLLAGATAQCFEKPSAPPDAASAEDQVRHLMTIPQPPPRKAVRLSPPPPPKTPPASPLAPQPATAQFAPTLRSPHNSHTDLPPHTGPQIRKTRLSR